jgi:hypothetical protein
MIPVIEAPFRAPTMSLTRGPDGVSARGQTTRARAIRVAAITRGTDRKKLIAVATDLLAKRCVHDVDAAARFDWTSQSIRDTRAND